MSIDGLKRTIHILAGLLLSASISVPALAVSAQQDARSYPSDFRYGVMLDYIYTQQLEAPYSSVWGGTEIERVGYRRTVYIETNEKSVFAGLVEFECRALGFVTIREYNLEMGVPADLTGVPVNGGEAIGSDPEWDRPGWDGSFSTRLSDPESWSQRGTDAYGNYAPLPYETFLQVRDHFCGPRAPEWTGNGDAYSADYRGYVVNLKPNEGLQTWSDYNVNSDRLGVIPHTAGEVYVDWCITRSGKVWCDVFYDGMRGWIDAPNNIAPHDGDF
jgi:hypothetical protein